MKQSPIENAPNMVLSNDQGHLFLINDSNQCQEQHLGQALISDQVADAWAIHLNDLMNLKRERNFKFTFVPAPDKQSVYWNSLSKSTDNRNIKKILSKLNASSYIDPLPALLELKNKGIDPYPLIDTHWNSYGALSCINSVISLWGIDAIPYLGGHIKPYEFYGDLGIKLSPQVSGRAHHFDASIWKNQLLYDNGVPDNGRIRIFKNNKAAVCAKCLIVGDSFSYRLVDFLAQYFSTVFHFHGHYIDRQINRLIQPDYFIFEQTERFFLRPPKHSVESNFFRLIEEKIESGVEVQSIIEKHRKIPSNDEYDLSSALVIKATEDYLFKFGLIDSPFRFSGETYFMRSFRTYFI